MTAKFEGNKKGRWTEEEKEYIRKHIGDKPLPEIALELKRPLKALIRYKNKEYGKVTTKDIKEGLRATPEWKQLTKQFYEDELDVFEHRYAEVVAQFADDIMATEKTQIFQLIKYEILMDRNLNDKKRTMDVLKTLQGELQTLRKKAKTQEDAAMLQAMVEKERGIEISMNSKTAEYLSLQKQHESILKNLKATRDQRIKNAETRRQTWVDVIKQLEEKEFRDKEGAELAIMQKAIQKEAQRLGEYHQYSNDVVDKPILSWETINEP